VTLLCLFFHFFYSKGFLVLFFVVSLIIISFFPAQTPLRAFGYGPTRYRIRSLVALFRSSDPARVDSAREDARLELLMPADMHRRPHKEKSHFLAAFAARGQGLPRYTRDVVSSDMVAVVTDRVNTGLFHRVARLQSLGHSMPLFVRLHIMRPRTFHVKLGKAARNVRFGTRCFSNWCFSAVWAKAHELTRGFVLARCSRGARATPKPVGAGCRPGQTSPGRAVLAPHTRR